jgi:hypothetical protein
VTKTKQKKNKKKQKTASTDLANDRLELKGGDGITHLLKLLSRADGETSDGS